MSIVRNFNLYLNAGNGSAPYINVNQYDQGEQWVFTLYKEDGTKYLPSTGAIVGIKADNRGIINTGTVDAEGRVVINETQQMTASAGRAIYELSIDGLTHGTANFIVAVERKPTDDAVMSDSDLSLIQEAVDAVSEIEDLLGGQDVPTVITPIIADWLDDNITNPSSPPIDTSLTVAGAAADAKKTGDEITDLKSAIQLTSESVYTVNAEPSDGFIPFVTNLNDTVSFKAASGQQFAGHTAVGFYSADKTALATWVVNSNYGFERVAIINDIAQTAYYIKLVVSGWDGEPLIITNRSNLEYNTAKCFSDSINEKVQYALYQTVNQTSNQKDGYIALNVGLGSTVSTTPVSSVQRKHIILPCKEGDTFILTATGGSAPRAWGFTDTNYTLLSVANSGANATNLLLTAVQDGYFIANHDVTKDYSLSATQLYKAEPHSIDPITVAADGTGDYTSFTQAIYENVDSGADVFVKPGTYDIVAEYVAIFGQSAVDNMADSDGAVFNGFQYGVNITNRKVIFNSGANLVCDWTGHTVDGTHRFSALRVGMDAEIIGLNLDCTGTFYAIHDDYGNNQTPYTNVYRNCRVIGHNLSNANCIGGGCKKYSRHIIDNCYMDNGGLPTSTTVRYHNTNADGAVPELYISNSYFNGGVTPRYYGTQTTKMKAYVNNCKAHHIEVAQESGNYTVNNVELYKWCNEEG